MEIDSPAELPALHVYVPESDVDGLPIVNVAPVEPGTSVLSL